MYTFQAYKTAMATLHNLVDRDALLGPEFQYANLPDTVRDFVTRDFFEALSRDKQREVIGEATFDDPRAALWGSLRVVREYLEPHLNEQLTPAVRDWAGAYMADDATRAGV